MNSKEKATLVPKLRFPEFRDKDGWRKVFLIDTADRSVKWSFIGGPFGSNLKSSDYVTAGVRIIQLQNIGDGEFWDDYRIFTSPEKADELRSNNTFPGDIVISKMGDPVGRACLIPDLHDRYVMCSDGIRLVVDEKKHSKYFIYSLINSPLFRSTVEKAATGSTRKRVGLDELKNLPMRLPAKAEQQKIANCLSSLDALIAAQARKVDTLKTQKKGLMQQLFPRQGETQPHLRLPEFQNAGEWEERKAGTLFTNRTAKGEQGLPIYSVTTNDGMVKRDSLDRKVVDIEDAAANKRVFQNDIAYNMMRMWQGAMGVAPEDCLVSPAYVVLTPKNDAVPQFFQYMFKLPAMLLVLTSHSRGLTEDRLRLYFDDFARIAFRCPTTQEQKRIANLLASLDKCISTELRELEALQAHKKGLMQQLFPSVEAFDA